MSSTLISKVVIAAIVTLFTGVLMAPRTLAQSSQSQASKVQPQMPQWQIDAGGTAKFDVASLKQDTADQTPQTLHTNMPFDATDEFTSTGGLYSAANYGLGNYIFFAYKLSPYQLFVLYSPQLPKWYRTNRYDVEARASGSPTKDQFRLMLQALLADRFKLAVHWETREVPGFALVLDKPRTLGPRLRPHTDDASCSTAPPNNGSAAPAATVGGFPVACGSVETWLDAGRWHIAGRSVTMEQIAGRLTHSGNDDIVGDRPVLDKTGLAGEYDFAIEFSPSLSWFRGIADQPDPTGPTFLEALKGQLGLKLESKMEPVDVLVIDHVEEPSPN